MKFSDENLDYQSSLRLPIGKFIIKLHVLKSKTITHRWNNRKKSLFVEFRWALFVG